jgi:hypothetical protein
VRVAYRDPSFVYRQGEDGLWSAIHERLGIGAIARTRKEAGARLMTMVLERLQSLSEEELEAHFASCEKMGVDDNNRLVPLRDETPSG